MGKIDFSEKYHPEFEGYVWEKDKGIYISFIMAKNPNNGHFTKYLSELKEKYDWIKVPVPLGLMGLVCLKNGFVKEWEWFPEAKETAEIMVYRKGEQSAKK